ncbi:7-cyano-7-deazaguanine synthase [Kocuria marina]|uniref:7-cyano-7-deazaguanine synthase n=1 Tax=Kocuria marina TaxID=223184 RepID=UPI0019D102D6|nr:7-cyano-7-deazaguanine synthase [Kocuria indica]MBN6844662.1 7-cyano-7-deazaguanine synthase [Kocuria indica]
MGISKVAVLLSGGIDSTLVVDLVLQSHRHVTALFIDYGQQSVGAERKASQEIATHFGISWSSVTIGGISTAAGEIPGRNDLLIAAASVAYPRHSIAIGTHAGTGYSDCSPEHGAAWQGLLDVQYAGVVQLLAPLASLSKAEVVALALDRRIPLGHTYSCEAASVPCEACRSCADRRSLLDAA